jgi:hypothetical protein
LKDQELIRGINSPENDLAIRKVCAQFVTLCRQFGLLAAASVAVDGSKFKAVNNRDRNFTQAKMQRRMAQIETSVARYLDQLDTADRQEPSGARSMTVIVFEIIDWSGTHDKRPVALRGVLEKIREDRAGFEAKIRAPSRGLARFGYVRLGSCPHSTRLASVRSNRLSSAAGS